MKMVCFRKTCLTNCDKMLSFVTLKMWVPIYNHQWGILQFYVKNFVNFLLTVVNYIAAYFGM